MKKWIALGALALLLLIGVFGGCSSYNGLVGTENEVEKSWANVQSAYQQRLDTLPKFAKTAKLSAEFQIALQEKYVAARNTVSAAAESGDPATLESVASAQFEGLREGLRSFLTIQVEAVPEAKTEQLTELNSQIESVERVIKHERDAFNGAVKKYNDKVRKAPGRFVASMFGFDKKKSFEASKEAQTSPDLDLDLDFDKK